MKLAALTASAVFVLDQASKYVVLHVMDLDRIRAIDLLPPYLNLRMAWNKGINFGLFSGEDDLTRWALIVISLIISVWVWIWARREQHKPLVQLSTGLLIGGALGNVIDRLFYGAVVDFLNMSCCGLRNPWSFNPADISIFAGAIGLVLFSGGAPRVPAKKP